MHTLKVRLSEEEPVRLIASEEKEEHGRDVKFSFCNQECHYHANVTYTRVQGMGDPE
jgi:hypothetical protein